VHEPIWLAGKIVLRLSEISILNSITVTSVHQMTYFLQHILWWMPGDVMAGHQNYTGAGGGDAATPPPPITTTTSTTFSLY